MNITPEECKAYYSKRYNKLRAVIDMANKEGVPIPEFWEWMKEQKVVELKPNPIYTKKEYREMRAKQDEKIYTEEVMQKCHEMRKEGKTYNEIAKALNIGNANSLNSVYLQWKQRLAEEPQAESEPETKVAETTELNIRTLTNKAADILENNGMTLMGLFFNVESELGEVRVVVGNKKIIVKLSICDKNNQED